jgi:hypothetical protein
MRAEQRPERRSTTDESEWERFARARVAELAALWGVPGAADAFTVRLSGRLSRSLGRADSASGRVTLAKSLRGDEELLDQALCHELAHLIAFFLVGRAEPAHGPTWKRLLRLAGHQPVVRLPLPAAAAAGPERKMVRRFRHRCPVCQFTRTASRRMTRWRCADCAAAGLGGRLEIESEGRLR